MTFVEALIWEAWRAYQRPGFVAELVTYAIREAAKVHVQRTRQFWLYGCPSDREPRKSYQAALLVASYNGPDGVWNELDRDYR